MRQFGTGTSHITYTGPNIGPQLRRLFTNTYDIGTATIIFANLRVFPLQFFAVASLKP